MKIIVDLINKSFKVLENERSIYVGNNNADVLKLYCYNGGYHLENEFVSITGLLSNGRKIGPFTTDSAYDEEYIDGKLHTLANFTLTKQNGFTLSEGQLNITVWYNKTNDSGAIISKQAIGNLVFNVVKTANVDDNIIITDASGDVIYNFKLEIENIQSAVNSVNSSFLKFKQHTEESIMRLEDNKADLEVMWDAFDNYSEQIPYGDRKFAWLLNFTGDSLLIDMINELSSRDLFVDDKGKFWVEIGLEKPTVIEDIRITKQKKANGYLTGYGINSIIRSGTTIRVFTKSVAKDSTMTINEFIDLHKQVAIKEEVPTKVSQLENDTEYISLETLNDTKDELREYADNKVAGLVNSAPETLDTLKELSTALGNDPNFATTVAEQIGKKANKEDLNNKVDKSYKEENSTTLMGGKWVFTSLGNTKKWSSYENIIDFKDSLGNEYKALNMLAYVGNTFELIGITTLDKEIKIFSTKEKDGLGFNADQTFNQNYYLIFEQENNTVLGYMNDFNTKYVDINYATEEFVDEKIENAGVPTDLLDRVETLETLSEEAVYMEDTEFDVEEETGGSGNGGKEVIEITTPLLRIEQSEINFEFQDKWNNKYIIYDWSIDQQTFDGTGDLMTIRINSSEKILTNSTILIKVPYMGGIINNNTTYFKIYAPKGFVFVENFFNAKTYHEGCRYLDSDNFNYCRYTFETWDNGYHFIKIDFDDNGFATIYLFDEYEV